MNNQIATKLSFVGVVHDGKLDPLMLIFFLRYNAGYPFKQIKTTQQNKSSCLGIRGTRKGAKNY